MREVETKNVSADLENKVVRFASDTDNSATSGNHLSIGILLQNAGKITSQEADRIAQLQQKEGINFGSAAIQLELVNETDIQQVLSQQFDFPYIATMDKTVSEEIIAAYQPFSPQVENLRSVRNQLKLHWFNGERKRLSITSPNEHEGKSYLCANLAVVFSQLGEKTLLIDANLRSPKQHEFFKIQQPHGLSDLLAGRVDSSVIFKSPEFGDLSILPAGTIAPNPAELITRGLEKNLQRLTQQYDVILIDTPAFQSGTEAHMISVICKGALFVARQGQTQLKGLEEMQADFAVSGVQCLGAVINEF